MVVVVSLLFRDVVGETSTRGVLGRVEDPATIEGLIRTEEGLSRPSLNEDAMAGSLFFPE
jgi:hypothetical protein